MDSEPQPNSTVYSVTAAHRVKLWAFVCALAAICVFCLTVPFLFSHNFDALYAAFAGALLSGTGCAVVAAAALRASEQFAVADDGLLRHDARGRVTLLVWEGIGRVRVRPWLRRLEATDVTRSTKLRLPFDLVGYDELAERIIAQAPPEALSADDIGARTSPTMDGEAHVFRARYADALAPVVAPLVILLSILLYGAVLVLAWLVAFGALLYWLEAWLRIRVQPDALVFVRALRSQRVPLEDIADVSLLTDDTRRRTRPCILLLRTNGTRLAISGVREGERALYSALVDALQARGLATAAAEPADRTGEAVEAAS